ncbi:MAG: chitin disaccharide deacetylase [Sarcina sp.]
MKLIINADDFGLTKGVNKAIVDAYKKGALKSTTLMVNMAEVEEAVKLAKENKGLGVGLHLTATAGKPLRTDLKSLTSEEGKFHNYYELLDGRQNCDENELYMEWEAQIDKFVELMGEMPTHLDSHHFAHLIERYEHIAIKLAEKYNLPMRTTETNMEKKMVKYTMGFYDDRVSYEFFENDEANILDEEVMDLMCHPAYNDEVLEGLSRYTKTRELELEILTSDRVKDWVTKNNVEIVDYRIFK